MARRTLTIKRIDPWSVLKVGFLANLVLLGILLLAGRVVWFFIERLELIDRACEVASAAGFQDCGLNGGNIFRNALLLGLLGVVVQTGILVFASFLHNLIAELTGGLSMTVVDDGPDARVVGTAPARQGRPADPQRPGRSGKATPTAGAAADSTASSRLGDRASEVRAKTIAESPRPTPGSGAGQPTRPAPPSPTPGAGASSQPSPPQQPRPGTAPGQPGPQDPTQAQRPVDRDLFRGDS